LKRLFSRLRHIFSNAHCFLNYKPAGPPGSRFHHSLIPLGYFAWRNFLPAVAAAAAAAAAVAAAAAACVPSKRLDKGRTEKDAWQVRARARRPIVFSRRAVCVRLTENT
jgi:hypothetical protein